MVGSGLLKKRKEKKREKRGKEEERKGGKREKGDMINKTMLVLYSTLLLFVRQAKAQGRQN